MASGRQFEASQRLLSMLAEMSDALWECDLRSGALSIRPKPGQAPDWIPEPPPASLTEAAAWLEPWEWRALLRAWVTFRKQPATPLELEFWLRASSHAIRVRAVVTGYGEDGAPAVLTGTMNEVKSGWDSAGSIHPAIRVAVESSPDALIATDPQGRLRLCNRSAAELFHLPASSPATDLDTPWWKLSAGAVENQEQFDAAMAALLDTPTRAQPVDVQLAGGRMLECYPGLQVVRRREVGRLWRFRDVSSHHRTQRELRLAVERLELGLLGTNDGIFDWNLLTDEVYVSPIPDVPSGATAATWIHPDDREMSAAATRASIEQGVPYDVEYRTQRPGGPMRWIRARGRALRDENGRPYRFVGCFTDITTRREAVEALERREREYRTVLAQIHEVVFEANLDGLLRYLNPAWTDLLGHKVEDCLGAPLIDYVVPEDRDRVSQQLRNPSLEHGGRSIECRWLAAGGGSRWLELRPGRIGDPEHNPRVFGTLADVEARRAVQAETERARRSAEQANLAKTEFLAAVSHELRTPLGVIAGSNDLLLETSLDTEARHHAQVIRSNAQMLGRLIEDLLDISRIEAGQIEIESVPFDPVELLESVCDQFRATAQGKGLTLDLILAGALPERLLGDPHRLHQIMGNLAGNAIKFTHKGGVRIVAEPTPDGIRVAVEDSGVGVPAEAQERIFEKFVQLRVGKSGRRPGVGLGLTISRSLAERMGGRLCVQSIEGKGSSFIVELPLRRPESSPGAAPGSAPGLRIALRVRDAALRHSLGILLKRAGVEAIPCRSSQDLRRAVMNGACQAFLVDQSLASSAWFEEMLEAAASRGIAAGKLTGTATAPSLQEIARSVDRPVTTTRLRQFLEACGLGQAIGERSAKRRSVMRLWRRPPEVLLVDDNNDSLQVSAAIVRRCGCRVETACGGPEAVAKASRHRFDLILMDVEMPELDGLEATRRIRAAEEAGGRARAPIVALTAHAFAGSKDDCLAAGMDDHYSKPASMEGLEAKIAKWIPGDPLILCAGGGAEWTGAVRGAFAGAPQYRTVFASADKEAAALLAGRRVAAVLADTRAASSTALRAALRNAGGVPLILIASQPPGELQADEFLPLPFAPRHLLEALERQIWDTPPGEPAARSADGQSLPAEILALIPSYLRNRLEDVRTIEEAMSRTDFLSVQRIAHNLKGSGAGYGYPELSALGREMEESAKAGLRDQVAALNFKLSELVESLLKGNAAVYAR